MASEPDAWAPRQQPGSPRLPQQSERVRSLIQVLRRARRSFWWTGASKERQLAMNSAGVPRRWGSGAHMQGIVLHRTRGGAGCQVWSRCGSVRLVSNG